MAKAQNNKDNTKIQLTKQGLEEVKEELKELEEVKLPAVIERVAEARSHGDLKENAEYQNAREDQGFVEARIEEIKRVIANAQVVANTRSHTSVGMGSTVVVSLEKNPKKKFTYKLVGEFESDPTEGKISIDSPLGKALIGSKKGSKVKVQAPAGEVVYVIEEIK